MNELTNERTNVKNVLLFFLHSTILQFTYDTVPFQLFRVEDEIQHEEKERRKNAACRCQIVCL
jgi:hypothetical protein